MFSFINNMGKRFLLTVLSLFLFTCASYGYSNPRWFSMPVTVYVPNVSGSATVTNAFKTWQSRSSGTVRFNLRSSANLQSLSDISVSFVDNAKQPYSVVEKKTVFENSRKNSTSSYFYKINIVISRTNSSGKAYSQSELSAIALRAVGEALGVSASGDSGVMSSKFDLSNKSLDSSDIRLLNKVYKK